MTVLLSSTWNADPQAFTPTVWPDWLSTMTWAVTSDPATIVFEGRMSCADIDVAAEVLVDAIAVGAVIGDVVVGANA